MTSWEAVEGAPSPLGATWIAAEQAYNFALFSRHAERVTLLLYGRDVATPARAYQLDPASNKSGPVWHCRVPERAAPGALYYGYSVDGPRSAPHHFDPDKILLDPYARSIFFPPGFDRKAAIESGSNAGHAPLGLLAAGHGACDFDWGADTRPRHEADTIVYELHVRGFTAHPSSGVAAARRGTFAGLIDKIPHLVELGVTVVELMPVFQFDPQEGNFWGYMPLGFFAPHQEWAASKTDCGQHNEFRTLVKALHAAGIEVVLDVVYNHTAEGDQAGPVYSFKGIDNQSYYMLTDRPDAPYANFSGTGNSFNVGDPAVRRLVLDSLRYWTREMHVDGFRFDLASVFARRPDGSLDYAAPIFAEISADPELSGVRLIAEPWDAAGTSQLGRAFPGSTWAQWNGQFRDDVRRFVRGDEGMVGALMQRLYGSDDLFPDDLPNAYRPYQSVNYVTSHDGLTLWDLLSYDDRDTGSWNSGFEGDAGAPAEVLALRRRQAKNLLCLLFLANGTPMLRGGDEFLQTQGGNPNPYNQDNATSWLDWGRLRANADTFRFARLMIAFRKAHPSLARSRFWRGDVRWHGVGTGVDFSTASRSVAFFLSGASQGDDDLYVMINGYWEPLTFTLQEGAASGWRRVVDTGRDSPDDLREPAATTPLPSAAYEVGARSVVVLLRPKGPTA